MALSFNEVGTVAAPFLSISSSTLFHHNCTGVISDVSIVSLSAQAELTSSFSSNQAQDAFTSGLSGSFAVTDTSGLGHSSFGKRPNFVRSTLI